ncbi:DnaD domain-containing protein [Lactobacillaceae bacterium Scapto_B20]
MDKFIKRLINSGQTSIPNYLIDNYTKIGMDANELVVYLQFKRFFDRGIESPDIEDITSATALGQQAIYQILHSLIQKKLMTIQTKQDDHGKDFDRYNFDLMYEKLADLSNHDDNYEDNNQTQTNANQQSGLPINDRKRIFSSIEREFGRALSPIELETISQWLDTDHYRPEMIELALRESVLNQVYNLKYIDRILLNWDKKNIKTPNDVEKELARYEQRKHPNQQSNNDDDGPDIPIFKIK